MAIEMAPLRCLGRKCGAASLLITKKELAGEGEPAADIFTLSTYYVPGTVFSLL